MVTNSVSSKATIGKNVKIWNFAYVGDNVEIGNNVKIGSLAHIDYDVKIGENTLIEGMVYTPPLSRIGKNVFIGLGIAALPIIFLGAYDSNLAFPLFGEVKIPVLYLGIIVMMIPITGNTINSIDVLNGAASGFMTIASFSLTICLFIIQNYEIAIASLPLGFVSLAFYKYHKIPSKIFPGDSGALTFGGMYGAIAIVGGVEIVAAIALLPAVINSFLFLSSMKRIVEHRQIKEKPVEHTNDFTKTSNTDWPQNCDNNPTTKDQNNPH